MKDWDGILKRPATGSGDFTRYSPYYSHGNRLTLLATGAEAFAAMGAAIDAAQETVHLESYILRSDRTGEQFARRLMEKARRGVRVRVIFDSVGSLDIDPGYLSRLRNTGVQLLEYHPIAPWRPRWAWGRRDHRKVLVVDGRVAFTGGVNISDDHAPVSAGGSDWRDIHLRVEGPAARDLDRLFRAVWFKETGRWFVLARPALLHGGSSRVWVAANQEFLHRYRIRSAYLNALRSARREVLIANAYFLPEGRTRRALAAAARRGVSVKVLVQGRSDIRSVWYAGRFRYDYLLRHGVRIFEWPHSVLHAKAAAVDGDWSAVGTYNLDHRSLHHNLEVNLHVLDPDFGGKLSRLLSEDLGQSRELDLASWRRRPFLEKVLEAFFYLFRYLL